MTGIVMLFDQHFHFHNVCCTDERVGSRILCYLLVFLTCCRHLTIILNFPFIWCVKRDTGWQTFKRPGVDAFLEHLAQFYEIVVYTDEQNMVIWFCFCIFWMDTCHCYEYSYVWYVMLLCLLICAVCRPCYRKAGSQALH